MNDLTTKTPEGLWAEANSGNKEALAQLKESHPADYQWYIKAWDTFNLAWVALKTEFALNLGSIGHLAQAGADERLQELRERLAPKNVLEELLVERILVTWLETTMLDAMPKPEQTRLKSLYYKRQSRAHGRYLTAIKALAQVRKLQLPTIQVNIGSNQVNAAKVTMARKD
jgi:hypothetical protein